MIIAIAGTGTGVGKTTLTVALLRGMPGARAFKPIETGGDADGRALCEASGHDAGPGVILRTPVAANVAARIDGVALDPNALAADARRRATETSVLFVETAGGLYSPMTDELTNADWLARVPADRLVLVAPNRLGVLHDVEACRRAGAQIDLVVLTGPARDESGSSNLAEIGRRLAVVSMPSPEDATEVLAIVSRGTF